MNLWFQIDNGVVGQWVDFDPIGVYPDEYIWVDVGENPLGVESGWVAKLVDNEWLLSPPPPPTDDEVAIPIYRERNWRVAQAQPMITQIECLNALGLATDDELSSLGLWRAYVSDLARVNAQPGFPYAFVLPQPPFVI